MGGTRVLWSLPFVAALLAACSSDSAGSAQQPLVAPEAGGAAGAGGGTSSGGSVATGGSPSYGGSSAGGTSSGGSSAGGTSSGGMSSGGSSAGGTSSGGTSSGGTSSGGTSNGGSATGGSPSMGGPTIGGCAIFPADNEWNRDVSNDPVDPMSDAYMASMNAGSKNLHPDFGSDPTYGIPYVVVPATQPKVPISFDYADESDPGPYPIPPDAPIEGGPGASGDRHVLVVAQGECKLYEMFAASPDPSSGGWHCGSGAVFDLSSDALRPDGWTSADAAGLPILPGLARRDEAMSGEIRHALRFTVATTQQGYVHPATHQAGSTTDPSAPPMGLRVRLKKTFDVSTFTGASKVILVALQKYGMFVADNGSDWFISGATDTGWDDTDLEQIKGVPASAFEVVQVGTILH